MDYHRIYNEFIADRLAKQPVDGYFEKHHIKPSNMGGSDDPENLIRLTAGDHFFAHLLLAHIYGGEQWRGVEAMANMPGSSKRREIFIRRRWVEKARAVAAVFHAEKARAQHRNGLRAKSHSPEANAKRSATMRGHCAKNPDRLVSAWEAAFSPEANAKRRATVISGWENGKYDELRATRRKQFTENNPMNDPIAVAKVGLKSKAYSNRPDVIEARRKRITGDNNPAKQLSARKKIKAATKLRDMSQNGRQREVVNLDTGERFKSVTHASVSAGSRHVSSVCNGKRAKAGGFRWAYA